MAEGLKSLGPVRKALLDEVRAVDAGRGIDELDAKLERLDVGQLNLLQRFLSEGGWRDMVKDATLRILGERISARQRVEGVYASGDAGKPIEDAVPKQVSAVVERPFEGRANAGASVPESQPVVAATSNRASQVVSEVPKRGYGTVDFRTSGVRTTGFAAPAERREPLSPPKTSVSRWSYRPPEGRGRSYRPEGQ